MSERETLIRELLTEIVKRHADPDDPDYSWCDDDPCMWCVNANKVLDSL